jgi:hypothetical protein
MQIYPVEAEFFRADGRTDEQTERQTDMTEPTVTFRNFTNAPKMKVTEIYNKPRLMLSRC